MTAVWPLIAYVAAVFTLAGVLAYPIHGLLEFCCNEAPPFDKVVHRTLKLSALIALWPLMHWMELNSRRHWGYGARAGSFTADLSFGFLVGVGSLGLVVGCLLLLEVRVLTLRPEMTVAVFVAVLGKAIAAGLVIGLIEETWFRGALFGAIADKTNPSRAVWVTAVLFGAVHFIRADPASVPVNPTWTDGFTVIAQSFYQFADPAVIDSFLALVAAGVLLGLVRQRSGHLAQCIGIHAGWVAVIKTTKKVSEANPDAPFAVLVGGYDGVIGYLALLVFGMLSVGYYVAAGRTTSRPANGRSQRISSMR